MLQFLRESGCRKSEQLAPADLPWSAPGYSGARPSPVPGLLVHLDAQAVHQLVKAAEEIDDRHQLQDAVIVQSNHRPGTVIGVTSRRSSLIWSGVAVRRYFTDQ